jgi:hypothetical protein
MRKLQGRLSFANVTSVIALFVALGGTGLAASQLGKNTVGTKQLKKNAVTAEKIKDQAITAAKIQNGVLTGAQINASTLGTVPDAAHALNADSAANAANAAHAANAASAAHAATADTSADAGTLDGLNASDFAPAAEVQTPGRFVLDDPNPNDEGVQTPDLIAGAFKINGYCTQNNSGGEAELAAVTLYPSVDFAVSGFRGAEYKSIGFQSLPDYPLAILESSGSPIPRTYDLTVVGSNGDVVKISGSVEVNVFEPSGDCAFTFTVIGP